MAHTINLDAVLGTPLTETITLKAVAASKPASMSSTR